MGERDCLSELLQVIAGQPLLSHGTEEHVLLVEEALMEKGVCFSWPPYQNWRTAAPLSFGDVASPGPDGIKAMPALPSPLAVRLSGIAQQ